MYLLFFFFFACISHELLIKQSMHTRVRTHIHTPPIPFLVAQTVKNPPVMQRPGFDPWVRNIPWRREWQPTTLFLPREFHGQRSLEGCSCKQLDMTEGHSRYTYTYTQRQTHRQDCFKLLVS